jgi:hypothetical protein
MNERCEKQEFQRVLRRLIQRATGLIKSKQGNVGKPLKDKDVYSYLGISQHTFSRLINGSPPKDLGVLISCAKRLQATEAEISLLIALTCIIQYRRLTREKELVAEYFSKMLSVAWDKEVILKERHSIYNIVNNVLMDLKVQPIERIESKMVQNVKGHRKDEIDVAKAMNVIVNLRETADDSNLYNTISKVPIGELWDVAKTYENIIALDFNSMVRTKPIRGPIGNFEGRTYWGLGSIQVSFIKIEANEEIKHIQHPGIEFSFLIKGSGDVSLGDFKPVRVSEEGRRFVAMATDEFGHRFKAGPDGAEFIIFHTGWKPDTLRRLTKTITSVLPRSNF